MAKSKSSPSSKGSQKHITWSGKGGQKGSQKPVKWKGSK